MPKKSNHKDPLVQPDTGVLYNLHGATNQERLDQLEADFTAARTYQLSETPIYGLFDLTHLKSIHRHLFRDTYAWAGEIRTVDISKGNTRFANHQFIDNEMRKIAIVLLEDNYLTGLAIGEFSSKAAYYLSEINAIHPFREGNGRTLREFINLLAANSGYTIAWPDFAPAELLKQIIFAHHHHEKPLAELIACHLKPINSSKI